MSPLWRNIVLCYYLELFLGSCEHIFRFPSGLGMVVADILGANCGQALVFFLQVVLEEGELRIELSRPLPSRLSLRKRLSTSVTTMFLALRLGEPLESTEMRNASPVTRSKS